jgi:hypothetical protein
MKTYTTTKRFPIIAGMPLNGQGSNKLQEVGYYIKKFIYDSPEKDYLIGEKEVKRVLGVFSFAEFTLTFKYY